MKQIIAVFTFFLLAFHLSTGQAVTIDSPGFSLGFDKNGKPSSILNKKTGKDQILKRNPGPGFVDVMKQQ